MSDQNIIIAENGEGMSIFVPAVKGAKVSNLSLPTSTGIESKSSVKQVDSLSTEKYAEWGSDNKYPTNARIKSEKCGVFSQNAFIKTSMFFGQGLQYYKRNKEGKLVEHQSNEIDDFIDNSNLPMYLLQALASFNIHFISFAEMRMSRGSSQNKENKIKAISYLETEWCRKAQMENGHSKNLYYSPEFAEGGVFDDKNGEILPLFYPTTKDNFLKSLGSKRKFAVDIMFPSAGRVYYPNAPWSDLYEKESWLDVAINTPKLINTLHKNLINIKYVIHIPMNYWQFRYPKWETYVAKKRKDLIDKEAENMNDYLAGAKNQHKSFLAHYGFDPVSGKEYPGFKIEPIKDYTQHDAYLPNSTAANAEICYHQGLSPSGIGMQTPGGKLGAGSGSDIRVSTNREVALMSATEFVQLQPIRFIHKWNGWDKDIVWKIYRPFITTLDQDKSGQTETNAS